jgi:hypothetical protein
MQCIFKGIGITVNGKGFLNLVCMTVYLLPFTFYLFNCSNPVKTAGGVTSTGNSISGVVKDTSGAVVAGAEVTLYPEDWIPFENSIPSMPKQAASGDIMTTETDDKGVFQLTDVDPGAYNIIAFSDETGTVSIIRAVEMVEDRIVESLIAILEVPAAIVISLRDLSVEENDYFYIPGTDVYTQVTGPVPEFTTLDRVPPGRYSGIYHAAADDLPGTDILNKEIELDPGETELIGAFSAWEYKLKLSINTSPTGADITDYVINFPLLIRFTPSSLPDPSPFDHAQGDGGDIRFSSWNGRSLHYEIERWDPAFGGTGATEIWVLVDTIHGNSENQYIYMYAGNSEAPAQMSLPTVFDTANGFAGVWHLNSGAGDASLNGLHGTETGTQARDGAVAAGRWFNGVDTYIEVADHPALNFGTGDFTASAWVWEQAFYDDINQQVFCKRIEAAGQYELQVDNYNLLRADVGAVGGRQVLTSRTTIASGRWYHMALMREGGRAYLWVDGVREPYSVESAHDVNAAVSLVIGRDAQGGEFFHGIIDELRISGIARSADWMKLSYETQKPESDVVRIGN